PASTVRVTSRTAVRLPKRIVTLAISIFSPARIMGEVLMSEAGPAGPPPPRAGRRRAVRQARPAWRSRRFELVGVLVALGDEPSRLRRPPPQLLQGVAGIGH